MTDSISITGVHLKRIGEHVIVSVEIGGRWVDVIKEHHDSNFSHIVESLGIRRAYGDVLAVECTP